VCTAAQQACAQNRCPQTDARKQMPANRCPQTARCIHWKMFSKEDVLKKRCSQKKMFSKVSLLLDLHCKMTVGLPASMPTNSQQVCRRCMRCQTFSKVSSLLNVHHTRSTPHTTHTAYTKYTKHDTYTMHVLNLQIAIPKIHPQIHCNRLQHTATHCNTLFPRYTLKQRRV